ncbi:MAG: hypothetical protein AAF787_21165 [Chloroflexota bacterium]
MISSDYMLTIARWRQNDIRKDVERFREAEHAREVREHDTDDNRTEQKRQSRLRRRHA